jgi:hypothetical protein
MYVTLTEVPSVIRVCRRGVVCDDNDEVGNLRRRAGKLKILPLDKLTSEFVVVVEEADSAVLEGWCGPDGMTGVVLFKGLEEYSVEVVDVDGADLEEASALSVCGAARLEVLLPAPGLWEATVDSRSNLGT